MAEQVASPLEDIYRQLGIPLAGEGDFHDVKANTKVQPWGNPLFESIHESMDTEYGRAKKLVQVQQGMLRNFIEGAKAFDAMQRTQVPTVGNAQDMFPEMPLPKEATVMKPGPLLEAESMDTLQGTQQVQVPSRMQGPMPGVMTPLAEFHDNQRKLYGDSALSQDQLTAMKEKQGDGYYRGEPLAGLFTEGPRPLDTITVGQYGPEQAPSQFQELDRNMKLPPAFQSLLAANIHQKSLQPHAVQPHYPSAEERKYDDGMRLGVAAWMQDNPGKAPSPKDLHMIQQQVTGMFEKSPLPGSSKERLEKANADVAETTAENAPRQQRLAMEKDSSQTELNIAHSQEILGLFDARLAAMNAKAVADRAVGSKESINAFYKEQQLLLNRGKDRVGLAIELRKSGRADDKAYAAIMNLALEDLAASQKAEATNRSWFEKTFGDEPAVKISPAPEGTAAPRLTPPKMPPLNMQPMPQAVPQAPTQPDIEGEKRTALLDLIRSMQDGEVKSYKGQKYKRQGTKLVPVTKDK